MIIFYFQYSLKFKLFHFFHLSWMNLFRALPLLGSAQSVQVVAFSKACFVPFAKLGGETFWLAFSKACW